MRKLTLGAMALAFLAVGCKKSASNNNPESSVEETQAISYRACAANEVLEAQLKADPGLAARMQQIENFTNQVINDGSLKRLVGDTVVIPVYVHVLFNT